MSATNTEDEHDAMAFCPNLPFPSADYSPTYQVCALGPPHMAPASRNRKSKSNSKHRSAERHGSTVGGMSTVEHEASAMTGDRGALWRTGYIMKHLERRAGPAAERIDHAPPPYIAPPELHAGTIPADSPTALPTPGTPAVPVPGLGSAPSPTRGTNVGLVVGLLVGGAALLGVLAALGLIYWRRKAKNIRALSANITPWKPHVSSAEVNSLSMSSSFGNFVLVSTTTSEEEYLKLPSPEYKESFEDEEVKPVPRRPVKLSLSDPRRFSSPSLGATFMRAFRHSTAAGLTASASAPPSPSLDTRDRSLHVQRQKAAELAQMVRMKFVKEELPVNGNSCPELATFAKRPALTAGLGIVHEQSEVDIANTLLCALDRYSVSFDAESPTVPITNLFQVDRHGKVVRRSAAPSPVSPASDALPRTPLHRNELSDNGSIATEDEDIDDVNDAVIVRLGQARSMEIKPERGMLVSLHTSSSIASPPSTSLSTSVLPSAAPIGATIVRPKSTSALPVPAPLLSPISTSATSLSADIEETLEERVFAYRPSGPWSKANYQLTTPGQVRALTEALALAKPHTPHQQQQAWPWPAHRSAALDPEQGDD